MQRGPGIEAVENKIILFPLDNSSMFKVSLKQNNRALAVALSVEKENSRKLKNEKIFLQKEVEKLQLHNLLLRRKLNCLVCCKYLNLNQLNQASIIFLKQYCFLKW